MGWLIRIRIFFPGKYLQCLKKDYDVEFDDYGNEWRLNVRHRYVRKPRKKLAEINNFDEDVFEESSRAPEQNQENIPPHESAEEETVSKRPKGGQSHIN